MAKGANSRRSRRSSSPFFTVFAGVCWIGKRARKIRQRTLVVSRPGRGRGFKVFPHDATISACQRSALQISFGWRMTGSAFDAMDVSHDEFMRRRGGSSKEGAGSVGLGGRLADLIFGSWGVTSRLSFLLIAVTPLGAIRIPFLMHLETI